MLGIRHSTDENNNKEISVLNKKAHIQYTACGFTGCTKRYRNHTSLQLHRRTAHNIGTVKVTTSPKSQDGR